MLVGRRCLLPGSSAPWALSRMRHTRVPVAAQPHIPLGLASMVWTQFPEVNGLTELRKDEEHEEGGMREETQAWHF